jgi:hypothetical protein
MARYAIDWIISGTISVEAENEEQAQKLFATFTARDVVGNADSIVGQPDPQSVEGLSE